MLDWLWERRLETYFLKMPANTRVCKIQRSCRKTHRHHSRGKSSNLFNMPALEFVLFVRF